MLRLNENPAVASPLDKWPLPTVAAYVEPIAQIALMRDLRRYADGRIPGRSYLIAGHRGAGKTALVGRVIDLIRIEIMNASVRAEGTNLADRPFERPLLVKLHGPSMLSSEDDPPTDATAGGAAGAPGVTPADTAERPPAPAAPPRPAPGVHAALVQIGISLYRALAAEAATGFRAHARQARDENPDDRGELAAQMALDLDGGITPARLREYWLRVGRLREGVFWPKSADDTLASCQMEDQGAREIAAIATAAQTFQVC